MARSVEEAARAYEGSSEEEMNALLKALHGLKEHTSLDSAERALAPLDPRVHTLPAVYVLHRISPSGERQRARFFELALRFLASPRREHILAIPKKSASVCSTLRDAALSLSRASEAILALFACASAAQPSPNCLTSIHCDFVHLCALSSFHSASERALSLTFTHADPERAPLSSFDHLRFCYYGACSRIALGHLSLAKPLLLQALTAPATNLSAIAVAAYKKLVLVSLCLDSTSPQLPSSTTPSAVHRGVQSLCSSYTTFASKLENGGLMSAREWLANDTNRCELAGDNNFALAKQALCNWRRHRIMKLKSIYSMMPLSKLANDAGFHGESAEADAERTLVLMAEEGIIGARICEQTRSVEFDHPSKPYNSDDAVRELASAVDSAFALNSTVRSRHESIAIDPQYLGKRSASQSSPVGTGALDDRG